jgi:hypothetical protein
MQCKRLEQSVLACQNAKLIRSLILANNRKGGAMRLLSIGVMCISMLMLAVASAARPSPEELKKQVADTERASPPR